MSCIEDKSSTVQCQSKQYDHRIFLIRNVRKSPSLYKNEFLRTPFLHRHEKQQMWDKIAQESGFGKTGEAKKKWRSVINYLRQHLDNVAQKKTRRYIPTTDNPDDKYVQLTDWHLYSELEFIVPYVKYAARDQGGDTLNHLELSSNEIDLIIEGIETEADEDKQYLDQHNEQSEELEGSEIIPDNKDNLTEDDEILKEYFENMLKSTLKLSRYHQNRIKQLLLNCLNEQSVK